MNLEVCVERALSLLTDDVRARFTESPMAVLREDLKLTVRPAEHLSDARDDGGACDGVSFLQDGVILYAPTPWSRRENFTLAHELGHWLVDQAPDVYDWLADQDEPGRLLETRATESPSAFFCQKLRPSRSSARGHSRRSI